MKPVPTANSSHYDLCIIGAGVAGANAMFVASKYLPAGTRVLLLDKHHQPGGMWNDAYSYLRLHQPHRLFTVGNMRWKLNEPPEYLATSGEVLTHLGQCFDTIGKRLDVDARWGWTFQSHVEDAATVSITADDPDGGTHTFTAERLIDARSYEFQVNTPFKVSSTQVRSIAPQDLAGAGLLADGDNTPVWVIGGGKTAMDTANALLKANPGRPLGMIAGTGTHFFDRDQLFPAGSSRWTSGVRANAYLAEIALRFDGTNTDAVTQWTRTRANISLLDSAPHTMFGFHSPAEEANIRAGLKELVSDHLVDIVDDPDGPTMVLRTGARHPVEADSWVVNCTGHFAHRVAVHTPYITPTGRVLSVNPTSMVLFPLSTFSAYFLTHLFFLNRLADAPLYELDFHGIRRIAPEAVTAVASALIMHNLSVIFERVPKRVFQQNGLDLDRWYPVPRRISGQIQFMLAHKRNRRHHQKSLDAFSRATGVRCAPLD
jgi:NAD(P)-binding Rossmann-like domain